MCLPLAFDFEPECALSLDAPETVEHRITRRKHAERSSAEVLNLPMERPVSVFPEYRNRGPTRDGRRLRQCRPYCAGESFAPGADASFAARSFKALAVTPGGRLMISPTVSWFMLVSCGLAATSSLIADFDPK
jgi:hypothetical protein